MNINLLRSIIIVGGISILLPSCVANKKYKAAQANIESLKNQNKDLSDNLSSAKSRLQLMEDANESAADEIANKQKAIQDRDNEIASQQDKLVQLQTMMDQQKERTNLLRNKMKDALKGFQSDQLTVTTKNGKVYVSLQESLLFPSGSAVVNEAGKEALKILADVLNVNPDITINVEGHTDSIPIKNKFEDNWALSVARATSIVRILTVDYHVNPESVIASGHSQFDPVAENATTEGRAKNRRTEIILEPKLNILYDYIDDIPTAQ